MTKKIFLKKKQLKELLAVTIKILKYIKSEGKNINDKEIQDALKNIQVPVRLSESIALHLLRDKKIKLGNITKVENFDFGQKKGAFDIEYNCKKIRKTIEVKATGADEFQRFREHALKSHYTIWIDFNGFRKKSISSSIRFLYFKTNTVFKNQVTQKEISFSKLLTKPYFMVPTKHKI